MGKREARTIDGSVRCALDRLAAVDEVRSRTSDRDLDDLGEDGRERDREEQAEPAVVPDDSGGVSQWELVHRGRKVIVERVEGAGHETALTSPRTSDAR